jgi:RND family efflux transporter MFP subunit
VDTVIAGQLFNRITERSRAEANEERVGHMTSRMTKLGLFLMIAMLGIAGCSRREGEDPRALPILVRTTTLDNPSGGYRSFTGVVTARVESDLGFRVSGLITQRLVDVGQTVHAGQPLMKMDITDFAHAITNQEEVVRAAQAKADQTAADEARYRPLVASGAISASTYDQVKAAADAARADLQAVEAQERIAHDQGDYSVLAADADGTVVDTLAEPGQVVAAGQTVIRLAHAGPREAAVYLPETLRPRLGSEVHAELFGSNEQASARLRQLSDAADASTRTFEARYVLEGAGARAPLGATVTVSLPAADIANTIAVPNAAVIDRGRGPGIWIVNGSNSTVSFHRVKVLRIDEEDTYIDDNVPSGAQVVALGAQLLSEGQTVRVSEEKAALR